MAGRIALNCITLSVLAGKILGLLLTWKKMIEASEGLVVVTVEQCELKSGPLDTKFTALDQHSKTISINDTVKVFERSI